MDSTSLLSFVCRCLLICLVFLQYGNTVPAKVSTINILAFEKEEKSEQKYSEVLSKLRELESRVEHLEMEDNWHCKDTPQTMESLNDNLKQSHRGKVGCKTQASKVQTTGLKTPEQPVRRSKEKDDDDDPKSMINLTCVMRPNKALPPDRRPDVSGKVVLSQLPTGKLMITAKLHGLIKFLKDSNSTLTPSKGTIVKKYGLHVHEFGNLTNGCNSAGQHFNPFKKNHGPPEFRGDFPGVGNRHRGDLGNLEGDQLGNVDASYIYNIPGALFPGPLSYLGKALVVHENEDDLGRFPNDPGSITTGNSGERIGCCVIIPFGQ